MIRSQSSNRLSYKNLSYRIYKIKAVSKAHSTYSTQKLSNSPSPLPPKPTSSHRGVLQVNENGMFAYQADKANKGDRVGIKKYNHMHVKEVLANGVDKWQGNRSYNNTQQEFYGRDVNRVSSPRFNEYSRLNATSYIPKQYNFSNQQPIYPTLYPLSHSPQSPPRSRFEMPPSLSSPASPPKPLPYSPSPSSPSSPPFKPTPSPYNYLPEFKGPEHQGYVSHFDMQGGRGEREYIASREQREYRVYKEQRGLKESYYERGLVPGRVYTVEVLYRFLR